VQREALTAEDAEDAEFRRKKMKNQFPKQIHIVFDPHNDTDQPQFLADRSAPNLIEDDGPTEVATYELKLVRNS